MHILKVNYPYVGRRRREQNASYGTWAHLATRREDATVRRVSRIWPRSVARLALIFNHKLLHLITPLGADSCVVYVCDRFLECILSQRGLTSEVTFLSQMQDGLGSLVACQMFYFNPGSKSCLRGWIRLIYRGSICINVHFWIISRTATWCGACFAGVWRVARLLSFLPLAYINNRPAKQLTTRPIRPGVGLALWGWPRRNHCLGGEL